MLVIHKRKIQNLVFVFNRPPTASSNFTPNAIPVKCQPAWNGTLVCLEAKCETNMCVYQCLIIIIIIINIINKASTPLTRASTSNENKHQHNYRVIFCLIHKYAFNT